MEYIIPQAIGLVLVELGKAFLTLNALSHIFVCFISIKYRTVSGLLFQKRGQGVNQLSCYMSNREH